MQWTKDFFAEIGRYRQPQVDAYDLHFYNWNVLKNDDSDVDFDENAWKRVIKSSLELEDVILEQYALIQEGIRNFPESEGFDEPEEYKCDLIVGEWGNWHGSASRTRPALYQQCTMRDAITTALTLDIFHRHCDIVKMACMAQTVNVLNSLILTSGEHTILTPNYDVFLMYKVHRGAEKIEIDTKSLDEDIYLFASGKDQEIYINIINADCKNAKTVELSFDKEIEAVSVQTLKSSCMTDYNSVEEPDKIRKKDGKIPVKTDGKYVFCADAASVNVLTFSVKDR